MTTRWATVISVILHPAIMPTVAFSILLFGLPHSFTAESTWYLLGYVVMVTFVFPAVNILWLYRAGFIRSLHMKERTDRPPAFWTTVIYYTCLTAMFAYKTGFSQLTQTILTIFITLLITTLVTQFFKVSAHAVGISGTLGLTFAWTLQNPENPTLFLVILALLLACGLSMSARLQLQAHSQKELYAGFMLGFLSCNFLTLYLAN